MSEEHDVPRAAITFQALCASKHLEAGVAQNLIVGPHPAGSSSFLLSVTLHLMTKTATC
ncbi:hypothetical protein ACP70R_015906 [Stipagrostis hirtigluma subsp. patula]